MNKSVYKYLIYKYYVCDLFFHVSYRFWPLNQNTLMILWHQLLLYLFVYFTSSTPYEMNERSPYIYKKMNKQTNEWTNKQINTMT